MTVVTLTQISQAPVQKFAFDYDTAISKLMDLLEEYETWKEDHLSAWIHRWGVKVIRSIQKLSQADESSVDAAWKDVLKRADKLKTKILLNPFDREHPLENPVLVNKLLIGHPEISDSMMKFKYGLSIDGLTFEKWVLDDLQKVFHVQGEISSKPHTFAKSIIEWVKRLPQQKLQSQDLVVASFLLEAQPSKKASWYFKIIKTIIETWKKKDDAREIKALNRRFAATLEIVAEQTRNEVQKAQQRMAEHIAKVNAKIETIERAHQEIQATMRAQHEQMEKKLEETRNALEAAKSRCAANENAIRELQIQAAYLQDQIYQIQRRLQEQEDSGWCTIA